MTDRIVVVASTFTATPLDGPLSHALAGAASPPRLEWVLYGQVASYLLAPGTVFAGAEIAATMVIVRVEDWLRAPVQATTEAEGLSREAARGILTESIDAIVEQLRVATSRSQPVWLMCCPSSGWVAQKGQLAGLCRTFSNLLVARAQASTQVRLVKFPADATWDDASADRRGQIPYRPEGYGALARAIAGALGGIDAAASKEKSDGVASVEELASFFRSLEMSVSLRRATEQDAPAIEHLLHTVSAFNLAGEPDHAASIGDLSPWWLVEVRDRFARHGTSGAVACRVDAHRLIVDSLVLSCPVLGKQVEFAVLHALAEIARRADCREIVLSYREAARNGAAGQFVRVLSADRGARSIVIPVADVPAVVRKTAVCADVLRYELLS